LQKYDERSVDKPARYQTKLSTEALFMKKFVSTLLLILLIPSLVLGGQSIPDLTQIPTTKNTEISANNPEPQQNIQLAHVTDADKQALRCPEEATSKRLPGTISVCSFRRLPLGMVGFAGGVLIAIHAGAD
jgi:hypothetical protein